METKESLQKYTIAQLKEKLRQRNLAISGTKPELINRLYESLQEEETLLAGGDATADIDADELLGTNISISSSLPTNDELLLLEPENTTATNTGGKQPSEPALPANPPAAAEPVTSTEQPQSVVEQPKSRHAPITITNDDTPVAERVASNEAKKKRAERFGIFEAAEKAAASATAKPAPATEAAANGAAKKRAAPAPKVQDEKFIQRAKRFGLPIGTETEPKIRKANIDDEAEKKREARKIRFGQQ